MASLIIPDRCQEGLKNLRSLSDDSFGKLLITLEKSHPLNINLDEMVEQITSEISDIPGDHLKNIFKTLFSLSYARAEAGVSSQTLASDVCKAMQEIDELKFPEEDFSAFQDRLVKLLDLDSIIYPSKAAGLLREFERQFCDSKIITDIRPIFGKPEQKPVGAVITHTLKLTYHEGGDHKELYLALDLDNIIAIKKVLERAELKDNSLNNLLQNIEMPNLEPKTKT